MGVKCRMHDVGEKHLATTSFIISAIQKTIMGRIIVVVGEIPSFNR